MTEEVKSFQPGKEKAQGFLVMTFHLLKGRQLGEWRLSLHKEPHAVVVGQWIQAALGEISF